MMMKMITNTLSSIADQKYLMALLPNELVLIILEFMSIVDVVKLDNAMTNHTWRSEWIQLKNVRKHPDYKCIQRIKVPDLKSVTLLSHNKVFVSRVKRSTIINLNTGLIESKLLNDFARHVVEISPGKLGICCLYGSFCTWSSSDGVLQVHHKGMVDTCKALLVGDGMIALFTPNKVLLCDLPTVNILHTINYEYPRYSELDLFVLVDGRICITSAISKEISIINCQTGNRDLTRRFTDFCSFVAEIDKEGKCGNLLVIHGYRHNVLGYSYWDLQTNEVISMNLQNATLQITVPNNDSGRMLYEILSKNKKVILKEFAFRRDFHLLLAICSGTCMYKYFLSDGSNRFVVCDQPHNTHLEVIDTTTCEIHTKLRVRNREVEVVGVLPDGKIVTLTRSSSVIRVWEINS